MSNTNPKDCINFDNNDNKNCNENILVKDISLNLTSNEEDIILIVEEDVYIDESDFINSDDVEEIEESENFDLLYKMNTNKHREQGKHQLPRDTIFKGKIEEKNPEKEDGQDSPDKQDNYDVSNIFDIQYNEGDDYLNQNNLTRDVYGILNDKTKLDFKQNRRKPNKELFNNYYNILLRELSFKYTKSEIFVELSYYFTDNIFNMFKLLDKKPANAIIKELIQKGYLKNISGINFL
jgi:hypothetical protein